MQLFVWSLSDGRLLNWFFAPPNTDTEEGTSAKERDDQRVWRLQNSGAEVYLFDCCGPDRAGGVGSRVGVRIFAEPLITDRPLRIPTLCARTCTSRSAISSNRSQANRQSEKVLGDSQWAKSIHASVTTEDSELVVVDVVKGDVSKRFRPYENSTIAEVAVAWIRPLPNAKSGRIDPKLKPKGYVLTVHLNGFAFATDMTGHTLPVWWSKTEGHLSPNERISHYVDHRRGMWTIRSCAHGLRTMDLHDESFTVLVNNAYVGNPPALSSQFSLQTSNNHYIAVGTAGLYFTKNVSRSTAGGGVVNVGLWYSSAKTSLGTAFSLRPNSDVEVHPTSWLDEPNPMRDIARKEEYATSVLTMAVAEPKFMVLVYATGAVQVMDFVSPPLKNVPLSLTETVDSKYKLHDFVVIIDPQSVKHLNNNDDDDDDAEREPRVAFVGEVIRMAHGSLQVKGYPVYQSESDSLTSSEFDALQKRAAHFDRSMASRSKSHPYSSFGQKSWTSMNSEEKNRLRSVTLLTKYRGGSGVENGEDRWIAANSPYVQSIGQPQSSDEKGEVEVDIVEGDHPVGSGEDVKNGGGGGGWVQPYQKNYSMIDFNLPYFGLGDEARRPPVVLTTNQLENLPSNQTPAERAISLLSKEAELDKVYDRSMRPKSQRESALIQHTIGPYVIFPSATLGTFICCRWDAPFISKSKVAPPSVRVGGPLPTANQRYKGNKKWW